MALTNIAKDTEYINKLVEIKRYYRSEEKFLELVETANKVVEESDYTDLWRYKRENLINFLRDYFQLSEKEGSYIVMTNNTGPDNYDSYSVTIEIGKSPIKPKYTIGTDDMVSI